MTGLVSIIIPTFDRPRYLQEAIESALAQSYADVEVLVFDNGNLAETLAVGEEMARRDPRVRFQRNERNLGMSGNFNALANAARGEFIVAIGDDDRLLPDFVARLVDAMTSAVRVAFSNHYLIDSEGRRLETESVAYNQQYGRDLLPPGILEKPEASAWRQSIPMSASLLRTEDMLRLRFREDLNAPDTEFFIRLASEGADFVFVPEYLMEYRVHLQAESASGLWSEQLVECLTPLAVKPEVECYKRQFLTPMVVNGVSRCLQQGKMEMARKLLRNRYYPRRRRGATVEEQPAESDRRFSRPDGTENLRRTLGGLFQGFCANLPASIGSAIYRGVRRATLAGVRRHHT